MVEMRLKNISKPFLLDILSFLHELDTQFFNVLMTKEVKTFWKNIEVFPVVYEMYLPFMICTFRIVDKI